MSKPTLYFLYSWPDEPSGFLALLDGKEVKCNEAYRVKPKNHPNGLGVRPATFLGMGFPLNKKTDNWPAGSGMIRLAPGIMEEWDGSEKD